MKLILILLVLILFYYCYCYNSNKIEEFAVDTDSANKIIIDTGDILNKLHIDNGIVTKNLLVDGHVRSNNTIIVPVGSIIPLYGNIPSGWLLCDGSAIDNKYNKLIKLIGNNTPDLRGRTPIGSQGKGNNLTNRALLSKGGSERSTVNISQMPAHMHIANNVGNHTHSYVGPYGNTAICSTQGHFHSFIAWQNTSTDGEHAHDIYPFGGDHAHENMMPSFVLNFVIRAA